MISLQVAFNYHLSIALIWLKYFWKGRKIASHPSSHPWRILLSICYMLDTSDLRYSIYSAIRRRVYPLSRMVTITKSVLWSFALTRVLPFLNIPKDLEPSYKTKLDFWNCLGRKITPTYNRRNTIRVRYSARKSVILISSSLLSRINS